MEYRIDDYSHAPGVLLCIAAGNRWRLRDTPVDAEVTNWTFIDRQDKTVGAVTTRVDNDGVCFLSVEGSDANAELIRQGLSDYAKPATPVNSIARRGSSQKKSAVKEGKLSPEEALSQLTERLGIEAVDDNLFKTIDQALRKLDLTGPQVTRFARVTGIAKCNSDDLTQRVLSAGISQKLLDAVVAIVPVANEVI